jgi:hypothetical protein
MLSRVPNHPSLELLVPSHQPSVTTGEDSTSAGCSRVEKRKAQRDDEEDNSYEVEEILGHCRDKQANI